MNVNEYQTLAMTTLNPELEDVYKRQMISCMMSWYSWKGKQVLP